MPFTTMIKNVLGQLSFSLAQLSETEYTRPCQSLFNASIGQHVRHVIELYSCLYSGYETGVINYENRKRDSVIETDKDLAIEQVSMIRNSMLRPDKDLQLHVNYDEDSTNTTIVATNYHRELIYNLEHTVHHMALIRVGLNEVSKVEVPDGFGVATSTIKYRRSCAQ